MHRREIHWVRVFNAWAAFSAHCLLLCLYLHGSPTVSAAAQPNHYDDDQFVEYQAKVAWLGNFLKYVNWPENAEERDFLVIGVLGENPFGDLLGSLELVRGKKVVVRFFGGFENAPVVGGCHILFIGQSEKENLAPIFQAVQSKPVLTVSEIEGFVDKGGMINFTKDQKRVGFEVNHRAAVRVGLHINSQLLGHAQRVIAK